MTPDRRLEEAIQHRDISAAQQAINRGSSVDRPDLRGATALEWAVLRRDERMLAFVIARTHDIDHLDDGGATALHHAVAMQEPELVRLLLEAGARPGTSHVCGSTTYDLALRIGNDRILSLLDDCACGTMIISGPTADESTPAGRDTRPIPAHSPTLR